MAETWSPWFSWAMDLVGFLLTFGVTVLVTLLVTHRIQERRARRQNRADALFHLQMDTLQEFRRAAAAYEVAALSAYTDLYQWKGGEKTAAMQQYALTAYGNLNAALDGLENRFKDSSDVIELIERVREAHKKRHRIYDGLVDLRLDTEGPMDMWGLAEDRRRRFESLLDEARNLRKVLIGAVEADILGGG